MLRLLRFLPAVLTIIGVIRKNRSTTVKDTKKNRKRRSTFRK